jgi:hypothetical protein
MTTPHARSLPRRLPGWLARRLASSLSVVPVGALALALALAGCGGSTAGKAAKAGKTATAPRVASLDRSLEPCLEEWNSAANQTVRFAFDGEVQAAAKGPRERMLVMRNAAGACALVFAGDTSDSPRIWTRDAGIWAAQTVLPGETALKAITQAAAARPNVTAAITTPPDEEDPTVGLLVALPAGEQS